MRQHHEPSVSAPWAAGDLANKEIFEIAKMRLLRKAKQIWRNESGAVAIEFAIIGNVLIVLLLNIVDVGMFVYAHMQVEFAAQSGAHMIWMKCEPITHFPVSSNCPDYKAATNNVVAASIQSTTLGSQVSWQKIDPVEGYYCADNAGTLRYIGNLTITPPTSCSAYNQPDAKPGVYVRVDARYTFEPLFGAISVMKYANINKVVTKTAYVRLL